MQAPCGSGLAREGIYAVYLNGLRRLHRWQANSHRECCAALNGGVQDHCGSGLARDGSDAVYLNGLRLLHRWQASSHR